MLKMILVISVILFASSVQAFELTNAQQEVWDTLETQVAHGIAGRFDEEAKYIHRNFVAWGPELPAPEPWTEASKKLYETTFGGQEWLAYHMVPLTIEVTGATAILNVIFRGLVKGPDGEPVMQTQRLHNTWIKVNGQWQLLALYNSMLD